MKDLKWMKEEVQEQYEYYSNEYDTQAMAYEYVLDLIEQVEQPEVPEIPSYVSYYIEECKTWGVSLYEAFTHGENSPSMRTAEFMQTYPEDFARAYLDGYTIEEIKYYARTRLSNLANFNNNGENYFNTLPHPTTKSVWLDTKDRSIALTKLEWSKLNINEKNAIFVGVDKGPSEGGLTC